MPRKKVELPEQLKDKKRHHFRYVDYEYCQRVSQCVGIKSKRQYMLWIRTLEPAGFPLLPHMVYGGDWESWGKFLDTGNVPTCEYKGAVRADDLMPYWDAIAKIQSLQLLTMKEWYEAFNAGRIPSGIPRQPHLRYTMFYVNGGWKTFLGKTMKHRVEASQNLQKLFVLYRTVGRSGNVISVMIHGTGIGDLRAYVKAMGLDVLRIYLWCGIIMVSHRVMILVGCLLMLMKLYISLIRY